MDIEKLAQELHESGREAVEQGLTVAADHHGERTRAFLDWNSISEKAKEGRRVQARWLLAKYVVVPIVRELPGPPGFAQ